MTSTTPAQVRSRIAGAPISWGVCEVPGWGHQLAPERVLADMRDLGLTATEFGPEGFLPDEPQEKAAVLRTYGLQAVGGFLPLVLHDAAHDPIPEVDAFIDACLAAGAGVVVLAAATGTDGYDIRPTLDDAAWKVLLDHLDRIAEHAEARGVLAVVHPHMGTMVEGADDVQRVLEGSRISLCIDTGHLVAAGADPVAITVAHPERVGHVHLKDVDAAMARRVVEGEVSFSDAVRDGMWTVLGQGSVDVTALISALESAGYRGWYVLEQDLMLTEGEAGSEAGSTVGGEGPLADVRRCLAYVEGALS